jgi:hypothetical protein
MLALRICMSKQRCNSGRMRGTRAGGRHWDDRLRCRRRIGELLPRRLFRMSGKELPARSVVLLLRGVTDVWFPDELDFHVIRAG